MRKELKTKFKKRKLSGSTLQVLQRAEDLKIAGKHQKAIEVLQRVLVRDPECVEAIEEVADNLLSLDEFEKAENVAQFVLSLDSKSFIANHVLGFLEIHRGNWKK